MAKVEQHSIVINRLVEEVFAYVSNMENDLKWRFDPKAGIQIKKISDKTIGVGTIWRISIQWLNRVTEVEVTVTEYDPNRTFVIQNVLKPNSPETRWTFERLADSTRVCYANNAQRPFFFRLMDMLLLRSTDTQRFERKLARLKELLESQPTWLSDDRRPSKVEVG